MRLLNSLGTAFGNNKKLCWPMSNY